MKTVLTCMLFSAFVFSGSVDENSPAPEEARVVKMLNKAEMADWNIEKVVSDLSVNSKAELLPAPRLEALLNAKETQLGDKCYEAVHLQFFSLDQKAEVQKALDNYLKNRALLFPTAPEVFENEEYLVMIWQPFCLSDEAYKDERAERFTTSLAKKLKLKPSE